MGVNSVPYVQRLMDVQLKDLAIFCRVYIDDIVIALETFQQHLHHLQPLFDKLQALNITLEPTKSSIGYSSVQLLGLRVNALGMTTLE